MTTWEQLLENTFANLQVDSPVLGERVVNIDSVLFGVSLTSVTFKLKKNGGATGTLTAGVFNSAGLNLIHTFGTMSASSVSTSATDYTFDTTAMSGTLAVGDTIGIHFDPIGGGTVSMYVQGTDPFDGTNTVNCSWLNYLTPPAWGVETGSDRYFIFIGAIPPPASTGTRLSPPPIMVRF